MTYPCTYHTHMHFPVHLKHAATRLSYAWQRRNIESLPRGAAIVRAARITCKLQA